LCNLWLAPTISQRIPKTLLIDLNLCTQKSKTFHMKNTITQQQLLQQFNNYCNKSNNSEKLIYFQVHYSKTSVLAQCLRQ
ncbi:hypothetical protein BYT27DRAFT_7203470, partial [Phlegmacium glaucopus]